MLWIRVLWCDLGWTLMLLLFSIRERSENFDDNVIHWMLILIVSISSYLHEYILLGHIYCHAASARLLSLLHLMFLIYKIFWRRQWKNKKRCRTRIQNLNPISNFKTHSYYYVPLRRNGINYVSVRETWDICRLRHRGKDWWRRNAIKNQSWNN